MSYQKMRAHQRAAARRQLQNRLSVLPPVELLARPPRGWVKAIREALGMTTAQLARRLGVTQPRVVELERAEVNDRITLNSLKRAARALDCQVIYVLVPRKPFEALVEDRAQRLAARQMKSTQHTMELEAQSVDAADAKEQHARLIQRLLERASTKLWDEDE